MPDSTTWRRRVESIDWSAAKNDLDKVCGALLPRLITDDELHRLYLDGAFRSTVDMARHRFSSGEYRYLARPYPELVESLKQALYPKLLPIAQDWWARLGRPFDWPASLDEWLERCQAAGQTKSSAILLKIHQRRLERFASRPLRRTRLSVASRDQSQHAGPGLHGR